jgi:hypothetical protein
MNFITKYVKLTLVRLTPSCQDITYLISKSMDTELPLRKKLQVRIHIIGCYFCHRYREQLIRIKKTLNTASDLSDEGEFNERHTLSPDAYNRIKTAINRHSA